MTMRWDSIPDIILVCNSINRLTTDYNAEVDADKDHSTSRKMKDTWRPPPLGVLKINFDATFHDDTVATRIVMRNNNGTTLRVSTGCSVASSPF